MGVELVYEPSKKHSCKSDIESGDKPYGTVVTCVDCGQYWYVGWTMQYVDYKAWKKLRWYNFVLRGKV